MQLGWVDFSREDREKVLDVMNLLQEQSAVDEIGIGLVRDAFANLFFPGTSTVQTVAKYFLIVPYVLKEATEGRYGNDLNKILRRIDQEEKECGKLLMQNRPGEDGIIGRRVLPKNWVARKPSNIYWNGIRTYSICTQDLTIPELLKASITLQAQKKTSALGNKGDDAADSERDDVDAGREVATQLFSVPDDYYADWRTALSIHLTATEAAFLRKMIENSVSASLLGYLLRHSVDVTKYVDLYLGSMNATYSAVNKNVKMMIRLRTKNRYYNSEMFLRDLFCGKADNPQNPFELSAVAEATADFQQEKANQLEQIIKTVCRLPMMASVTERDGKYDVSLEITGQIPEGDISITPFRRNVLIPPGLKACPIPVCPCSI